MNADVEKAVSLDELKSAEIKFAQLAWRKALSEEDGYSGASKLMTECFRDGFYAGVRTYWDRVDAMHTERVQATQALRDQEAEIARLRAEQLDCDALRVRLTGILTATANALKGQPKPMQAHSWHDLSEVATRIITAHDNLLARIECGLSGIVLQAGDDENGLARVIVHCSREALSSGPNLIGKRVAMVVIE